jgi:hypothetical protein
MSLLEWFGESFDPGEAGTVDVGGRDREERGRAKRPRIAVLVCFAFAVALIGLGAYFVVSVYGVPTARGLVWLIFGTVLYLCLSYFVHPKPDTSNIGWMGGLFDHPFRYSDDINRFLIFLVIVLWPGRFISESLVDMVGLAVHAWKSGGGSSVEEDPE